MTEKLEPNVRYQFSEPWATRFEQIMKGIGLPDRSRREDDKQIYIEKAMKDKPPSEKQLEWIRKKGWNLEMPKTMAEASKILDMLFKK